MTISYKWLMEYLPQPVDIEELSHILTSIGLEVEAVEHVEMVKGSLEGLVIGEVLTCTKHPNADKLNLTTVNTGGDVPLKIVCGAPNVAAGQRVVVAPVGTTVYPLEGAPFLIKKAKIRNEESEGMICAEDEIGLGKSHDGIMILPKTAPIGMPAKEFFNIPEPDFAIHIGLTPNRSDAMSHIGVARDVCAYLSHHSDGNFIVRKPAINLPSKSADKPITVNVTATEACPRYAGIVIQDIQIAPSPEWLQQKLRTIGVRPINNVVDITNFVLHEYGQPLHAFDYDKIKGAAVNVRFPDAGATFITLDEKERKLTTEDLMICDADKGMCMAGVFGGLNSGITDQTNTIFLESAYFTPGFIRRTSLHHGLRTDAATHFEKGVDINNILPALERAAQLICELASGNIASDIIDVYAQPIMPVQVAFTYNYISNLCGKHYAADTIKTILTALQFEVTEETAEGMTVKVPSNKTDVSQPADIAEEILRIDGLDNVMIPSQLNIALTRPFPTDRQAREKIADTLCGIGFQELVTNSIVSSKFYPDRNDLVRMLNSLSSELDVMRPSMTESGLEVILYNCNRKNQNLSLFETGKIYYRENEAYREETKLAIWVTGEQQPAQWNKKAQQADIYYLKGLIEKLLSLSNISGAVSSTADQIITWKWKNQVLATAMAVPAKRLEEFDLKQEVFYADIDWDLWYKAATSRKITYSEIPRYPAVQRDLAIVLDKQVPYSEVQKVTNQVKLSALRSYGLFDVFENEKLGADKKSLALNYTFRLDDRTLTDAEIEQYMKELIKAYETKLQAQVRN